MNTAALKIGGKMQAQAKAIILARVSSKAQEDEGYSLDSQLKLMRDYCKSKKLVIIEEFKIAETASKEQRRKVYQEMLSYITKHRVFNVVVEKTDRLTRNFKDATMIDAWLEKDNRRMLHLVKETYYFIKKLVRTRSLCGISICLWLRSIRTTSAKKQ